MSDHRLDLTYADGSLDLVSGIAADEGYWFETLADGFDLGSPQAVKIVRQSLMRDGSDSTISHYDNRTVQFQVAVNAPDGLSLQLGERALSLATAGRAELSWTPPGGIGATTVYEVLNATFDPIVDDLAWVRPGVVQQVYVLTLECEPFGRAPDPVTVSFAPATPTITTLDDASVLTNWTLLTSHSFTSGSATMGTATHLGDASVQLTYNAVARVSVTPVTTYIAVDFAGPRALSIARPDGVSSYSAVATELQASGFTRYFFVAPAGPVDLYAGWVSGDAPESYIGGVYGATAVPATGVLAADVPGSVRTQGVVTVEGGAALGDTMVYADPTMLTYGWQPDVDETWPQAPEGSYMIYRKSASSWLGGTFSATAGGQTVSTYLAPSTVPDNSWFPVGRVALGGLRSGRLGSTFSPLVDTDTRLFRMASDTSLTYVRGLTETRLLIDIPSMEYPRGGVWAGAEGSEASVLDSTDAWEFPTLTPPVTAFFIRAAGDSTPDSTATFYPRAHTFNAYEAS